MKTDSTEINGGTAYIEIMAFPRNGHPDKGDYPVNGMSLRDYFAAKAMSRIPFGEYETGKVAKIAYDTADAMLEAREK